jgi:hypothetical protein
MSTLLNDDDAEGQRKSFEALRARAALSSQQLHEQHVGRDSETTYWASKWGHTRTFSTLAALQTWVDLVTGVDSDPGRRERERRTAIDVATRQRDRSDEVLDLKRGAGGSS